ncbi:MAG: 5'-methylthioadenosine/S-adenosylhomocysteine nucleosidase, partial [Thiotrichales bacterium 32-46-8]
MIGIIGAMAEEVEAFKTAMMDTKTQTIAGVDFFIGHIQQVKVVLAQSGIGKVNAALT